MNQELVEITALGEGGVWVEGMQRSACNSCSARAGCGKHTLSQLGRPVKLWVSTTGHWRIGQQVLLVLPAGGLALSALVLYGLPLLLLLPAAMLGQLWGGDGLAALLALLALVAGFWLGRILTRTAGYRWQPQIQSSCSRQLIHSDAVQTE